MEKLISWSLIGVFLVASLCWAGYVSAAPAEAPEAVYEALNPRGIPEPIQLQSLAPRISDLNDKTVYVVNCGKTYAEEILAAIAKALPDYFPRVKVVHTSKKEWYGTDEPALWKEVKERADAVVIAPKD